MNCMSVIEIPVNQLSGVVLDWLVQLSVNPLVNLNQFLTLPSHPSLSKGTFDYSSNWAEGGLLVDSHGIAVRKVWHNQGRQDKNWHALGEGSDVGFHWEARVNVNGDENAVWVAGPTALVAAMRSLVLRYHGKTIRLPLHTWERLMEKQNRKA